MMCSRGRGVQEDQARAAQLYQKACDGGDAPGCGALGWMYTNGTGVEKDDAKAAELFQKGRDLKRSQ